MAVASGLMKHKNCVENLNMVPYGIRALLGSWSSMSINLTLFVPFKILTAHVILLL